MNVFTRVCFTLRVCLLGDFLSESRVYEDLLDTKSLKTFMETHLEDYNLTPGVVPMSLVLFRDAVEHSTSENMHIQTHPDTCFSGRTGQTISLIHQPSVPPTTFCSVNSIYYHNQYKRSSFAAL